MIYLAPIQGFTDYVYRHAFLNVFSGIDAFFIPYISVKNQQILSKHIQQILPENNANGKVIPQVLIKDADELLYLANVLEDFGYSDINLNLGCPYPMVTKRRKGSGLLPFPDEIKTILTAFFEKSNLKLSVKLRAGLISEKEIEKVIPVLNEFNLSELILHPRVAKQLYKGKIYETAFQFVSENAKNKVVYNGDIFSVSDYEKRKQTFPSINNWMLGRGVLMNPFLPSEIKGIQFLKNEKKEKLKEFHRLVLEKYIEKMDNQGNTLNKMQQFWIYFSNNFSDSHKVFKHIKKSKDIHNYSSAVKRIFSNY